MIYLFCGYRMVQNTEAQAKMDSAASVMRADDSTKLNGDLKHRHNVASAVSNQDDGVTMMDNSRSQPAAAATKGE